MPWGSLLPENLCNIDVIQNFKNIEKTNAPADISKIMSSFMRQVFHSFDSIDASEISWNGLYKFDMIPDLKACLIRGQFSTVKAPYCH